MSNWLNNSEVVAGLVFSGRVSVSNVDPSLFAPPYDKLIKRLRDGETVAELTAENFGSVNAGMQAADAMAPNMMEADILKALAKSKVSNEGATLFTQAARRFERGEEVDQAVILDLFSRLDTGEDIFTPLSEVKEEEGIYTPSHFKAIDYHIGGFPKSSLIIVASPPGTGKTSLLGKIALLMAEKEKKKKVLLFTLEMTMGQILKRFLQIGLMGKKVKEKQDILSRIVATDKPLTIAEIDMYASRRCASENISMIGIDFADMTVQGEKTSAAMEQAYQTCARLAKKTGVPVVLLAQLSEKYVGGIPQVNHIRWSRMAEAFAALLLLIYNPGQIFVDQGESRKNPPLPVVDGMGYLIVGKARYGTTHEGIGAIQLSWDGATSWGDENGKWFFLKGA